MTLKRLRSEETRQRPGPSWSTPDYRPLAPHPRAVRAQRHQGGCARPFSDATKRAPLSGKTSGDFHAGATRPARVSDVMTPETLRSQETAHADNFWPVRRPSWSRTLWQDAEARSEWRIVPVVLQDGRHYVAAMIIWRGWGILTLFVTVAGVLGFLAVVTALMGDGEMTSMLGGGIGILAAGVANFFLGRWLNLIRPAREAEGFRNQLRAKLWERVANNSFQVSPGAPAPSSEQEAAQQIEQIVESRTRDVARARSNIHTFFFIPLQWIGVVEGIGGLATVLYSPLAG